LKKLLEYRGLTIEELAEQASMSKVELKKWETLDPNEAIDLDELVRVCRFFKCSADYLIGLRDK